jgi:hypothetical protein
MRRRKGKTVTRRGFIAGAAGAAAAAALPAAALAQRATNPPDPIDGQLGAIAQQLANVEAHLHRIDEATANPPDPIFVDRLSLVRGEAEDIIAIADDMLRRLR